MRRSASSIKSVPALSFRFQVGSRARHSAEKAGRWSWERPEGPGGNTIDIGGLPLWERAVWIPRSLAHCIRRHDYEAAQNRKCLLMQISHLYSSLEDCEKKTENLVKDNEFLLLEVQDKTKQILQIYSKGFVEDNLISSYSNCFFRQANCSDRPSWSTWRTWGNKTNTCTAIIWRLRPKQTGSRSNSRSLKGKVTSTLRTTKSNPRSTKTQ